jgi:spermidine synthase
MLPTLTHMRRRILFCVFVVSGFTGLIYESIWSQYLKLFLGHAGYAQTLVLTIFMGGLAIGSWIVARYSARLRSLLWGYLVVEGVTGVLGMLFHPLFVTASEFSLNSVIPRLPAGLAIDVYKWSVGALLILPQSILLGMTFPLLSGAMIRRWPDRPGETLATLYFTNSLGATLGVLVSGFVLVGMVGLPGTVLTAGLLNIALALAVWLQVREGPEPQPAPTGVSTQSPDIASAASWFAAAAFLTGAASFMYELGWIRMLSLVLGSSTHAFELMLAAFIFGLAMGGLYVRKRIDRISSLEGYLGGVMILMGTLAALTLPAYNSSFDLMAWALRTFTRSESGYAAFNVASQTIAMLTMVPATFCAGMTLPLLTHALMRCGAGEQSIGKIYSLNTLGSIVGVVLTVHLLMPLIGVKGVILSGAVLHIGVGIWSLVRVRPVRMRSAGLATATGLAVFIVTALVVKLDPARMASGVFRSGRAALPPDIHVKYLRDGKTATISLGEISGRLYVATNGKSDAAINMGAGSPTSDETTMVLAGAIPLSLHPHPGRVANIGFGSGLTTHTLLTSGLVERVDSIEIEPVIVEASRRGFGPRIHNVFEDPRSHIVYDDAKTFFARTREPYDLIVSEPSNPWVSGVASLFSDEFYTRVVHHLAPDGVFVQWVQIYETDLGVVASIVKALAPHFGAYRIYNLNDADILIVATRGAAFDPPDERRLQWPGLRAELDRIGVQSVADLQVRQIGDQHSLGRFLQSLPVPPNSDFFPFVDLHSAGLRFMNSSAAQLPLLSITPAPFLEFFQGWPSGSTLAPSAHSALARDAAVREALAIRHGIIDGRLENIPPTSVMPLLVLDASAGRCAGPEGREAWKHSIQWLSNATAPYLDAAELAEMWSRIKSSPCYRDVPGEHRTWVDFHTAVAARDAPAVVKLGTELLAADPARSQDELTYLTASIAVADVRMGELADASKLLQSQWTRLDHSGPYDIPLRELLVLSQGKGSAQVARASP